MKKKIITCILAITILFSAMPSTITVEAGVEKWICSKVTEVTTTVIKRHVSGLLYKYSQTDGVGSTVSGLIYKYVSGPTTTKLLTIMDTTEEILNGIGEIDQQLTDIENTLDNEFGEIKALITEDEMKEEQARITDITSHYSVSYQLLDATLKEIFNNGGDYDGDGEVGDDDLDEINSKYRDIYNNLPNDADTFREDIYALANVVSDDGGDAKVNADEIGGHNDNDQTYIKAVKTNMEVNYPFTYQKDIALDYAANFTFQKQIQMLVLCTEMISWLEGELESNTELTLLERNEYKERYEDYSSNYQYIYNITVNSINNAAEQMDLNGAIGYDDLSVTLEGNEDVSVYQTQLQEYYTGTEYYAGDIYLFPQEPLSVKKGISPTYTVLEQDVHTTALVPWTYIDEYRYSFDKDKYKYYSNPDASSGMYGYSYSNVSNISNGETLFEKIKPGFSFSDFLSMNGIDCGTYDYVLFQSQEEFAVLDSGSRTSVEDGYEVRDRIIADQAIGIEPTGLVNTTEDDTLTTVTGKDLENDTYINIYKQVGTPKHELTYNVSEFVQLQDATTKRQSPEDGVAFTVEYDMPQVDIDDITVTRDNGEKVAVYSPDYEDDGSIECQFYMPYQGVTIEITATENRHDIQLEQPSNGTVTVDSTARYGDIVSVNTHADEGYSLSELNVTDIDGNIVPLSKEGTFEMPNCPVAMKATFVDISEIDGLDGSGTQDDPYQIADSFDWITFVSTVNNGNSLKGVYFVLTDDVDLTNKEYDALGDESNYFDGYLSGAGHKLTGFETFKMLNDHENYYLIGCLGENATVTDMILTDTIWSSDKNSAIVGVNHGTLSDIIVDITMSSDKTAFVYENHGTITNVANRSTLTGNDNYGFAVYNEGIIEKSTFAGYIENGIAFVMENKATGVLKNIENSGENVTTMAGIAEENYGRIESAINHSDMIDIEDYASGIVAINEGVVNRCTNYGDLIAVKSNNMAFSGGIAGINTGTVSNSGNYGDIGTSNSSAIGGIVGRLDSGAILLNSFNRGNVHGSEMVGGLVGNVRIEPKPVAIHYCYTSGTVEEMKDVSDTGSKIEATEKVPYVGSAIGAIFGESGFQLAIDSELVAEQISKNAVVIDTDTPTQLMIPNFDNATAQSKKIVSFVQKSEIISFVKKLNHEILNNSHGSVNLSYWTVADGIDDSLPFHENSEYKAIFQDESQGENEGDTSDHAVETGDTTPIALVVVVMLLSVLMMVALMKRRNNSK